MKKLLTAMVLALTALQSFAADATWTTSLPEAQMKAKKEHKMVLLDFTGSDWCVWCQRMDKETLSTPEFKKYAAANLVLVELDYPNAKPQSDALKTANKALQKKYNVEGFPTFIVLDADGKTVLTQEGYLAGGPAAFIKKLNEAKGSPRA